MGGASGGDTSGDAWSYIGIDGADSEARQAITNALEKSGLQLLTDQTGGES